MEHHVMNDTDLAARAVDSDPLTVAVLGTGSMGAPIARTLLRAGFRVRVWNRTKAKAEALTETLLTRWRQAIEQGHGDQDVAAVTLARTRADAPVH
jgi:3-hydroxyisobutyrate dehydrogenase-like beta-hydroxyacid dehydrogenase